MMPFISGMSGVLYLASAVLLGGVFLGVCVEDLS